MKKRERRTGRKDATCICSSMTFCFSCCWRDLFYYWREYYEEYVCLTPQTRPATVTLTLGNEVV